MPAETRRTDTHRAKALPPPTKLLVVRLSAHGDIVQTLPLLTELKTHWPHLHIGWLVQQEGKELLEGHPDIDTLHVWHKKDKATWLPLLKELRAAGYTQALDVQGLLKSSLWPWLAGIPQRVGFANAREGAPLLYNRTVRGHGFKDVFTDPVTAHATQQWLGLLQAWLPHYSPPATWGTPLPQLNPQEQAEFEAFWAAQVQPYLRPQAPTWVVAPCTRWPSKHWPMAQWQQVVAGLHALGYNVLGLGTAGEAPSVAQVFEGLPECHPTQPLSPSPRGWVNLAGQTRLRQLYSLLPRVQGLLGVDSAPLHLAAMVNRALATPQNPTPLRVLGLYGPTLASRTGPGTGGGDTLYLPPGILPCQPCHKKQCLLLPTTTVTTPVAHAPCLQRLEPQQVLQWVRWQGWQEALMDLKLESLDATL